MSKIVPSPSKYSLRLLLVLQAMETMLYTIDHINGAREAILPAGVSVGAHVLDDCDTDTYGLEQAVDFIKGRKDEEEIQSAFVLSELRTSTSNFGMFIFIPGLWSPLQRGQGHVVAINSTGWQLMLFNGLS